MIPGLSKQLNGMPVDDKAFVKVEAIINSMTPAERRKPNIISGSRRKRIASGSGTKVQDVNQLLNQFNEMKKMMKRMKKMKFRGMPKVGSFPF
jgi:signal recognition particle subunit SRP54